MKVVVLAGGTSTERDVSLVTGSMVYKALKEKGHDAILVDAFYGLQPALLTELGLDGTETPSKVFTLDRDWSESISAIGESNPDLEKVKALRPESPDGYFGPHVLSLCKSADIVFLALHGENGENGKVQAAFDLRGIRYTGTGYLSSALAMDKTLTKNLFVQFGVPTPYGFVLRPDEPVKLPEEYPCVVKTACGGSSVGVYLPKNEEEYYLAVKEGFSFGSDLIVEQYIKGREFSVGVVDGQAYPVIEIAPKEGFYDYKNKYQAGSTVETCPAELSPELTKAMQEAAERAYEALRMESYARMDFMMNEAGEFFCLEGNTLPGMTPTSLLPQEAAALGEDFPTLCDKLINVSLRKYEK